MPKLDTTTLATLFAALLLLALFDRARSRVWLLVPLVLPATLLHEGSHWLVAKLSGAQPARFSVWPRREPGRLVLGEVAIARGNWLNRGLVGLAPLLLLPLALWAVQALPPPQSPAWHAGHAYLIASLLYGSLPSWTDWRLALRGFVGAVLMLALVAGWAWWQWGRAAV